MREPWPEIQLVVAPKAECWLTARHALRGGFQMRCQSGPPCHLCRRTQTHCQAFLHDHLIPEMLWALGTPAG